MTLRELSKPQWDAALIAARRFERGNPHNAADRAAFCDAKSALADLLPEGADAGDLILQAVRWDALNSMAAIFAGVPA